MNKSADQKTARSINLCRIVLKYYLELCQSDAAKANNDDIIATVHNSDGSIREIKQSDTNFDFVGGFSEVVNQTISRKNAGEISQLTRDLQEMARDFPKNIRDAINSEILSTLGDDSDFV